MTTKRDSNKPKQAERLTLKKETVKDLDPRDAEVKGGLTVAGTNRCSLRWSGCGN
jgi:hypothetical protein